MRVCVCACYPAVAPVLVAPHAVAVVQSHRAVLRDGVETQLPGVQRVPGPDVLPPAEGEDLRRASENAPLTTRGNKDNNNYCTSQCKTLKK